ncbi:pentapeptide repeat-containing protein [Streptomyces canus]|uniref:pentapeptide repeat-containing protein n=1 Tax=Streptomyces canus TaxID=58343 RepID=UPI003CF85BF9
MAMLLDMKAQMKRIALAVVLALVVVGYAILLWKGPWLLDGAHLRTKNLQPADGVVITGFRTMLVALGAGAVAALGLYYTHKSHKQTEALFEHTRDKDREQAELTREGQVTERYVEAIKLLSSDNVTQRLGGIYALERIMRDSDRDHVTVVEVLAAFVRQHAAEVDEARPYPPREDVGAAMIVMGRRPLDGEPFAPNLAGVKLRAAELVGADFRSTTFDYADLSAANLTGANLYSGSFRDAILSAANLSEASLTHAHLQSAELRKTNLTSAELKYANLRKVDLTDARMQFADLTKADLRHAVLCRARMAYVTLESADLRGADLSEALDVPLEELCKAHLDARTQLPQGLASDPRVQERVAEGA